MFNLSKWPRWGGFVVLTALAMLLASSYAPTQVLAATSPSLGAAGSYSVLAGSIVTNTGVTPATTMNGDLGISPSIGVPPHFTGFPPGIVGPPGAIHSADSHAAAAQAADTAVFGFINQPATVDYSGTGVKSLNDLNLGPGVYAADAFTLSGTLTLSGSGVWIFKSASTLITSGPAKVVGDDPCNVWWRVGSSATLGTDTHFIGNILALTDIGLQHGATLNGRALAQTGQVTLDSNTITSPVCSGGAPNPLLLLTKSVTPATYSHLNDVLYYTLNATNSGNVTLTGVSISDNPGLTITNDGGQPVILAPGETLTVTGTHTITQGDLDAGSFHNTATASSTSPLVSGTASVTTWALKSGANIALTKSVTPATYSQVGDVLYYTLVATNNGSFNLTNVSITDPKLDSILPAPPQGATLLPGETLTVIGTHTITQGDLSTGYFNNTAAASGTPESGAPVSATASQESLRAKSVGGEDGTINKARVLAPWVGLGLILILGGTVLTVLLLRRHTSR